MTNEILISERPAEAEDRAVPGHWEGDLILGLDRSAIGTLVSVPAGFTMLLHLPAATRSDYACHQARAACVGTWRRGGPRYAISEQITTLPVQLRRSLTWDQGKEMAEHARFTVDTGVQVYFCDPIARGSGAATRTPTGCCASTSPSAPISAG